ncbi:MAG: alpha/beta hydrolase [Candidatus Heimdallarchaeota archaeon]|nr:alpha/beta hydrolase [Candidatus Heimdallarchaeota archaeon]
MPYCESNEINLYYEITGNGEPLLLIAGITASTLIWPRYFVDKLSKKYQVIIFDNRGVGKTDGPNYPYSIDQFTKDTIGLMNHLGLESVNLYGESMGGMIAQNLVLKYPDRIKSLILAVTTTGNKGVKLTEGARYLLLNHLKGDYMEDNLKFYEYVYTPEFFDRHRETIKNLLENPPDYPVQQEYAYRHQLAAISSTHDTKDQLHEIKIPTLILVGMKDRLVPPQNSLLIHDLIPNSKLIKYENAAHMYRFEEPNSILDILKFLTAV